MSQVRMMIIVPTRCCISIVRGHCVLCRSLFVDFVLVRVLYICISALVIFTLVARLGDDRSMVIMVMISTGARAQRLDKSAAAAGLTLPTSVNE